MVLKGLSPIKRTCIHGFEPTPRESCALSFLYSLELPLIMDSNFHQCIFFFLFSFSSSTDAEAIRSIFMSPL